jgi:outer membrane biosynthesis protein TonB
VELPLDHFRLLGVSPVANTEVVLRTLEQRLDRTPGPGFTSEALEARAELLRTSAELLGDAKRRQDYECLLTEQTSDGSGALPALEVSSALEVGGLLLLMESGQPAEAFEGARRSLQPPQAPALGSGREADLTLLAALACRQGGQERQRQRLFEPAAQLLQQGIQLLQRMGQQLDRRLELETDLQALMPYRVLDLISRDLADDQARQQGISLLVELISRRGGLDGEQDPNFPQAAFQSFFQQIRTFLTVQEQIDLFLRWSEQGSVTAEFLSAYALTASGFAQRKPERIEAALQRLEALREVGVEREMACLHLLLGHTREAELCFNRCSDQELQRWAKDQGDDPLAGICAYCRDWLERQVLPCYRDLEADPDLEAYFADRDVQAAIEREDRRQAQGLNTPGATITEFELLPTPSRSEFESLLDSPPLASPSGAAAPEEEEEEDEFHPGLADRLAEWWYAQNWDHPRSWLEKLQQLSNLQRAAVLGLALVSATAVGALLGRHQQPSTPPSQALLIPAPPQPKPSPAPTPVSKSPAKPAAAKNPEAAQKPEAAKPEAPKTTNPETETRALLQGWLGAKALLMAGGNNQATLEPLAVPNLVSTALANRQSDAQQGLHRKINAEVQELKLIASSPERREVRARILYSEEVLNGQDKLLERSGPIQLTNVYVFHRPSPDSSWKLADYHGGQ